MSAKNSTSSNVKTSNTKKPQASTGVAKKPAAPPFKQPVLRFSPTAWAKLVWFRDHGNTEVGGFAVTDGDDLLRVKDFVTVKQETTAASIEFDDIAVADYFEDQVDAGRRPEQFARIWLHTHPGNSAHPSGVDEETFTRAFGRCDWAIMFILAQNGATTCRIRFNVGPRGEADIPVVIDWQSEFGGSDITAWENEFDHNIVSNHPTLIYGSSTAAFGQNSSVRPMASAWGGQDLLPCDIIDDIEGLDPERRVDLMEELMGRTDLWEGTNVEWDYGDWDKSATTEDDEEVQLDQ